MQLERRASLGSNGSEERISIARITLRQKSFLQVQQGLNLRITEGAKDQWALENKKGTGSTPVASDLAPYTKNITFPATGVVGETYNINPVGIMATATTPVKLGTYTALSNITIP